MSPFQPGAEKAPEPKRPAGLAGSVGHTARQKPPDPKGKGLALALIAGAAVIAAIYQIATGSGAGQSVREQRERDARATEERTTDLVAPRDPNDDDTTSTVTRPPTIYDPGAPDEAPLPMPGANIPLPDGLSERTAGRLRLSLNALTSGGLVAESGIRELPLILADAGAEERDAVRSVVVDSLAALIGARRLGPTALDAATRLAGAGEAGLGPITLGVLSRGLKEDEGVPAALVYLEQLAPADREGATKEVAALVRDGGRPLHVRVLAARTLVRWDAVDEALVDLLTDPRTPAALREAIRSD